MFEVLGDSHGTLYLYSGGRVTQGYQLKIKKTPKQPTHQRTVALVYILYLFWDTETMYVPTGTYFNETKK